MSQIIRKKGKFSQKKPLHSDLIPIHSFDAAEEISISLLCTFLGAFLLPVDNVAQIRVVIDAITTTNGWRDLTGCSKVIGFVPHY